MDGNFVKLVGDILTSYITIAGAIIGIGIWANKKSISKIVEVVEKTISDSFEEVYKTIEQLQDDVKQVKEEQDKQHQKNLKQDKLIAYNHLLAMVKDYETKKSLDVNPQSYDLMNLSQAINEYYNVGNGGSLGKNAKSYLDEMQEVIDNK